MTQINNQTAPPPVDPVLKAEVTFCVQGVSGPPCGVPLFRSWTTPPVMIPLFR
jgi:hypothetical protein